MIRVGFVLSLDTSWQGGINYFKNLFNSIYSLPNRQLDLVVFLGTKNLHLILDDLPAVQIVISSAFDRYSLLWWFRKFFQKLVCKDPILWFLIRQHKIDLLSHFNESVLLKNTPIIAWIPDFQHIRIPDFFAKKEINARNKFFKFLAKTSNIVILSSYDANNDFVSFSPKYAEKVRVLQFCVNPDLKSKQTATLQDLQKRYQFNGNYFFLPNQFWVHKNHQVVIDALSIAVKSNKEVQVICTGNTNDYRQPEYFKSLQKKLQTLGIERNFKILGLVPYQDLISLMHHAIAIINPSYFEGWSTTVEESKLLQKIALLSNIDVHVEQNPQRALYFDVNDSQKLAQYLLDIMSKNFEDPFVLQNALNNYDELFVKFGNEYQNIVLDLIFK